MEQYAWILWIVLGICLIVAEIFTFGFVLFWFGIGALAAAFAGLLGIGFIGQFIIFAVVSVAFTVLSRTLFSNLFSLGADDEVKIGMESLPGQIGTVISPSKGALQSAEVKVYGSTWTAIPEGGENPFLEGEKVEVVRVQGATIYVRRVRELPDWREN
jgi:membrane protein implicated in regulation of membrane protease activity